MAEKNIPKPKSQIATVSGSLEPRSRFYNTIHIGKKKLARMRTSHKLGALCIVILLVALLFVTVYALRHKEDNGPDITQEQALLVIENGTGTSETLTDEQKSLLLTKDADPNTQYDVAYLQAKLYYNNGDYKKAATIYSKLNSVKSNRDILTAYGFACWNAGDIACAKQAFSQAVSEYEKAQDTYSVNKYKAILLELEG